ncbi:MAG: hypothetical protein JWO33_435 [Caulobacteraceae bacterium]|nr:hypothetical protein [Caulobacteraceae bacterium]
MSNLLPLIAVFGLALATGAHAAGATAASSAVIFKPVTIGTVVNINSGNVKTTGNVTSGTVTMPATFPLQAAPQPTYTGGWAKNGANAAAGNAARVDVSGQPGAPFQLVLSGWQYVSGDNPLSMTAPTYYSTSGSPTNSANGVFNAAGNATLYIGATFTIPRDPNGTTVVMRPQFTIVYN